MTWSIFGKCDVCAPHQKVASLSGRRRRLIGELYQVLGSQAANHGEYSALPIPQACELCSLEIESVNRCAPVLLQRHLNGNMQTNPHDPKEGKETDNGAAELPHEYNCDCHECQVKFGSLPLLVQVIEYQEKSSLESAAAGSTSAAGEPEPSTSFAKPSVSPNLKTMVCPHCSKNFTHRGDLNKHVRKHTGEQPYTCHVCTRRFAHTSNLNRHLKVHSGDKPFVCSACNKTFSRKDKLEMHKKTKLCKKFSERL